MIDGPGEVHWCTLYDITGDNEPFGETCRCDIGEDHEIADLDGDFQEGGAMTDARAALEAYAEESPIESVPLLRRDSLAPRVFDALHEILDSCDITDRKGRKEGLSPQLVRAIILNALKEENR